MLKKIEHYKSALTQLEKAIEAYTNAPRDALYRDGLIQRFEFTAELAWKSMKEYLEDQGVVLTIPSPRGVLKEAYAVGIINDAEVWNKIINARNMTSHVYDETTADNIANDVCGVFFPVFKALGTFYSGE